MIPFHAGRLVPIGLLTISIVCQELAIPQSSETPVFPAQVQKQLGPTGVQRAEEWMRKGDEADRAGNRQEAIRAYQEAIREYRQVISRNPSHAGTWKNLGFVYWLCDQKNDAFAAYKESIRLQPGDAESHYMLGLIQWNVLDAAIVEFREAVRLRPAETEYRLALGRALAQKNELQESIAEFGEASRLDPGDGESHASLGGVLQKKGDNTGAISEYQKALARKLTKTSADRVHQSLANLLALEKPTKNSDAKYWVSRAREWRKAIAEHSPGESDEAAVAIGSWPIDEVSTLIGLVRSSIANLTKNPASKKTDSSRDWILRSLDIREDPNPILKLGALLHSDIARLQLETGREDGFSPGLAAIDDGRSIWHRGRRHWEFARLLLDSATPDPSNDEMIRQWYIANTAELLKLRQWIYAGENIKRALEIFPNDPIIQFYAGVLHEHYALPKNQNALPPKGMHFVGYGSTRFELEQARLFFEKAVTANREFGEARLHLGRVLGQIGDHNQAVAELEKSADSVRDPQLFYYVSLYLGYEFSMLNRKAEARQRYETAARLYPSAQSALIAMSHLAFVSGDRKGARLAAEEILALPEKNSQLIDPWLEYDVSSVRDASALLRDMQKAFGRLRK